VVTSSPLPYIIIITTCFTHPSISLTPLSLICSSHLYPSHLFCSPHHLTHPIYLYLPPIIPLHVHIPPHLLILLYTTTLSLILQSFWSFHSSPSYHYPSHIITIHHCSYVCLILPSICHHPHLITHPYCYNYLISLMLLYPHHHHRIIPITPSHHRSLHFFALLSAVITHQVSSFLQPPHTSSHCYLSVAYKLLHSPLINSLTGLLRYPNCCITVVVPSWLSHLHHIITTAPLHLYKLLSRTVIPTPPSLHHHHRYIPTVIPSPFSLYHHIPAVLPSLYHYTHATTFISSPSCHHTHITIPVLIPSQSHCCNQITTPLSSLYFSILLQLCHCYQKSPPLYNSRPTTILVRCLVSVSHKHIITVG